MDARLLITFLSISGVYALVPFSLALLSRADNKKNPNAFWYPKFMVSVGTFIIFAVVLALCVEMDRLMIWDRYTWACLIMCSVVFVFGVWFTLFFSFTRVILTDTHLLYRNWVGRTRRYAYTAITRIVVKYNGNSAEQCIVYFGKRHVSVDCLQRGFKNFIPLLKKYMKQNDCRCKIEEKNRERNDIQHRKKQKKKPKRKHE